MTATRRVLFTSIVFFACLPVSVSGAVIVTDVTRSASSFASFDYLGTLHDAQMSVSHAGPASSQALAGLATTPEARTASRVTDSDIGANARLDGKTYFSLTDIQSNGSITVYEATVAKLSGSAERILLDFFLPPSYVETVTNGELQFTRVNPAIFASIESQLISSSGAAGPSVTQFEFQAYLDSSFREFSNFARAEAQAGLDVSSLNNPTLTDVQGGFLRTTTMSFEGFAGTVDLGVLSVGQSLTFKYRMEARALGSAAFSVGIAAINDPFFVDTDSIIAGAPVSIRSEPVTQSVPEPSALVMLATVLPAALVAFRRRANGAPASRQVVTDQRNDP